MKEVKIRLANQNDKNFIFATWLKNYKNSPFAKRITNEIFFKRHHEIIEHILKKSTTEILVAHPADDSEFILGYLVHERTSSDQLIHFAFVKSDFQRMGIGTQLVKHADINLNHVSFSHWTAPCQDLMLRYPTACHDPYRI